MISSLFCQDTKVGQLCINRVHSGLVLPHSFIAWKNTYIWLWALPLAHPVNISSNQTHPWWEITRAKISIMEIMITVVLIVATNVLFGPFFCFVLFVSQER